MSPTEGYDLNIAIMETKHVESNTGSSLYLILSGMKYKSKTFI